MADAWTLIGERLFPSIQWRLTEPSVCVTFDDGPHPVATPAALEVLRRYNLKGVFFLVGKNVEQNVDLVRRIVEEGHDIGNHSYSHRSLWFTSPSVVREELLRSHDVITRAANREPKLFRPPFSNFEPMLIAAARKAGYRFVMYSVDSKDYRLPDSALIAWQAARSLKPRDLVLFHDNEITASRLSASLELFIGSALAKGLDFSGI